MKLIVGLGNPGKEYEHTRHNVGFEIVDELAGGCDLDWTKDAKHKAWVSKGTIGGVLVLLAKPSTFMNESGTAVQGLLSYYKMDLQDLLVIHDEMDLQPGRLAFLAKGGAAGHNGIADIQTRLGSKDVPRLRIGVGRPMTQIAKEDWVLSKPNKEDAKAIRETQGKAVEAAKEWITSDLSKAMNIWNTK